MEAVISFPVFSAVREVLSGKRSMVLSRSTFAGSGKFTGHWLGDNFSQWKNMADSIVGMSSEKWKRNFKKYVHDP